MKPNYAIALFLLALPTQWMVADDELLKKMTPFLDAAMAHWEVPSLAIAVVKDGQVVLSGFGVRQIGSGKQVDEATLFNFAFCAKSFTAASCR